MMNRATSVAAIMALVAFLAQMDVANGLNCNTCAETKEKKGTCLTFACNSMADVTKSHGILSKHPGYSGELPDITQKDAKEFVCVRTLGKTSPDGPPDYTASYCAPSNPAFPPSDKAYPQEAFGAGAGPEKRSSAGKKSANGEVYVCDAKTGNGPNCGPKAVVG